MNTAMKNAMPDPSMKTTSTAGNRRAHGRLLLLPLLIAAVMACSSTPDRNPALDQARTRVDSAQRNNAVTTLAPDELRRAEEALNEAESAWEDREPSTTVNHLAYLTSQRVTIAMDTATSLSAQAITAGAAAERDRMLLTARTNDAATAQRQLNQSQLNNARTSADLARSQQDTATASANLTQSRQNNAQTSADLAQSRQNNAQTNADLARSQRTNAQTSADLATANANADAAAIRDQARSAADAARVSDLESQLRALNAVQTDRGMVITLGDVLFDTGESRILPGVAHNLEQVAEFFQRNPEQEASIEGHTDSVGSTSSNYSLSQRRADAVMSALMSMGVPSGRLATRSFGPDSPVTSNDTPSGRQLNRRVEIVFSQ